jgi:hypothetical protein
VNCLTLLKDTFGAQVIVDDLGFLKEPYFEDGPVAQAVAAIGDDVVYVSSAGNDGTVHHQATFTPVAFVDPGGLGTFTVHDFGLAAGQASSPNLPLTLQPGQAAVAVLQWDDPFDNATNDFSLVLTDANGFFLTQSSEVQPPSPPIEALLIPNFSDSPIVYNVQIQPIFMAPGLHTVEVFFAGIDHIDKFQIAQGSIYGHPAVPNALAVGAIRASDPGNDDIEDFSSQGPSDIAFPVPESRPKPDVASIDGVMVTGTGGFPSPFGGTSAAAPHVAGLAALLKELVPSATPAEIREAIRQGAVDLGAPGFDLVFGAGRSDAIGSRDVLPGGPPRLEVVEEEAFLASGEQGGPFAPSSRSYTLRNPTASNALTFGAEADAAWLEISPGNGTIGPLGQQQVTVSLSPEANSLGAGSHQGQMIFRDLTSGAEVTRTASLVVTDSMLPPSGPLFASVLPSTRSIQLGDIATVFATMINVGAEPAIGCAIGLLSEVPAALSFQTFDPVELVTGPVNTPVDIVGAQAFVLTLEPSGSFGPSELEILYDCQNTDPVVTLPALNTLGLLVSPDPVPDIVALAATLQGDGRVRAPVGGTGFFTVATSNVGIAGSITATADTGGVVLPLNLSLCQTDPVSGACLGAGPVDAASGVTLDIGAMEVPSFAIFATPSAPIPFMPASNRIFARFRNGEGVTLGATSVAFETVP